MEAPWPLKANQGPAVEAHVAPEPGVQAPLVDRRLNQILHRKPPEGVLVVGPDAEVERRGQKLVGVRRDRRIVARLEIRQHDVTEGEAVLHEPKGGTRRQAPALRHVHVVGIGQVQLREPVRSRGVIRNAATESVDVAAGRPGDLPLQVGERRLGSAVETGPLLAVAGLEFKAIGEAGKGGVLLEIVELPIGAQRKLLGVGRPEESHEEAEDGGEAEGETVDLHRMIATWPVSGGMGSSASLSSMT